MKQIRKALIIGAALMYLVGCSKKGMGPTDFKINESSPKIDVVQITPNRIRTGEKFYADVCSVDDDGIEGMIADFNGEEKRYTNVYRTKQKCHRFQFKAPETGTYDLDLKVFDTEGNKQITTKTIQVYD